MMKLLRLMMFCFLVRRRKAIHELYFCHWREWLWSDPPKLIHWKMNPDVWRLNTFPAREVKR